MGRTKALPFKIIALVVLLRATPLFAQFDFPSMSGAGAAMGGMTVALDDPQSAYITIANLATLQSANISLSVRQNLISEGLGTASVAAATPIGFGGIALSAIHFGDAEYNEQNISLAYALPLSENISLGAAFHYLHSATSDPYYDPLHRLTFSIALRYRPTDELYLAFRAFNPVAVLSYKEEKVHTPALFTLGASYLLTNELLTTAEVEKNFFYDATLRLGLQYCFHDNYYARLGIATKPLLYSFGFGAKWSHLGADMAFQFITPMGPAPQLSLFYLF